MTPAMTTSPMIGASVQTELAVVFVLFQAARAPEGNAVNVVADARLASTLYQIITPMTIAISNATTPTIAAGIPISAEWSFRSFMW